METRKSWFTYTYLTIFSICMVYTLLSGIINIWIFTPDPFLWYGWLLTAICVMLFANKFTFFLSRFNFNQHGILIESLFVITVLVIAASVRVWVIQNLPIAPASDYKTYYEVAELLLQGNLLKDGVEICGYISEFPHIIGYPYILSGVFQIFGVSVSVGLYFNMVVSLISVFLAYRIARLICGELGGMIALVLVAFWPSQILYINHLASEPVFTCMILFSLWLAIYLFKYPLEKGKPPVCLLLNIALGIALSLAGAVRPISIILLLAIILCILPGKVILHDDKNNIGLIKRAMAKGWVRAIAILISYTLCSQIISGTIAKTIDRELPGSSLSFGYNLMVGLNTSSIGTWNEQDAKLMKDKLLETNSAAEAHRAARDEALERVAKDPMGIAKLTLEKYTLLWKDDNYASSWNLLFMEKQNNLTPERKALINDLIPWNNLYYLLSVFFSFLAGIALRYRKRVGPEQILILFFIGTALFHMIMENQNRYHYDILPIFAVLAAIGMVEFSQVRTKRVKPH